MKIMIIEPLGDSGIAHYSYNLLNSLSSQNIESFLFTARDYELIKLKKRFTLYNRMFRVFSFLNKIIPSLSNEHQVIPSLLRKMIKAFEYPINALEALILCKIKGINIVHLQSVNLIEFVMVFLFKLFRFKVIFTIHNVIPNHKKIRSYHKILLGYMYYYCDKLIVHTIKGKEETINNFLVTRDKITVIPHGDYKFFVPERVITKCQAKKSLGISHDVKTILFFGAIRPNKGLDFILESLPKIIRKVSNVKLMIVGELAEDYNKYKQIINKNKLQDHVYEKLDYIPNEEVSDYFFASDVTVIPYYEITQSGVLQIVYAFGKPVVATKLPGFEETIVEGKNGYLVPINDYNALSDKIVEILTSDKKLDEMGKYSRCLADEKFSWGKIAKETSTVYRSRV